MNRRPGHVDVVTEVGFCNFCNRTRNLRREEHHLGALVRTIVTCETCHRTLSSSMGVAAPEPETGPEPAPAAEVETGAAVEKSKKAPPKRTPAKTATKAKPRPKAAPAKPRTPPKPRSTATRKPTGKK